MGSGNPSPLTLTERDFRPIGEFEFQHWGERAGEPYRSIRPLTPEAAQRAWDRMARMGASAWVETPDDPATDPPAPLHRLDLRRLDRWDEATVRNWLLAREPERDRTVIVCYQPTVAVAVPWGVLCGHWLVVLWTGGCVWPAGEQWVLIHDGDQFAFGVRAGE